MMRSFLALALTMGMASASFANNDKYFEISNVKVTDVTEQYSGMDVMAQKGLSEDCSQSGLPLAPKFSGDNTLGSLNPLDAVELVVDQIINIGKKIFSIVQAGRPVVNVRIDTANALPQGLTCWSDLTGWKAPQARVYQVEYENALGMTVVDFTYRVTFTAGGSADGVGKYITNATFMPANLNVGWGFAFDADANIPSVFNTGSKKAPVAGMQMNMGWKVTSPLSHIQATESFFVRGDNKLIQLQ